MTVKKGDTIKVHYTGTLDDGTVFDSSEGKDPLEFEVGSGKIIRGFDQGVMGMKKGEEKTIRIEAKDAYGEPNHQLVQKIPRDKIPAGQDVKEGMMVAIGMPDGNQIPAKIAKVDEKAITLDMNHPLAGKALNFRLKLVP